MSRPYLRLNLNFSKIRARVSVPSVSLPCMNGSCRPLQGLTAVVLGSMALLSCCPSVSPFSCLPLLPCPCNICSGDSKKAMNNLGVAALWPQAELHL